MQTAPIPINEAERLEALEALDVLDTGPEDEFDALVSAAAAVCEAPISLVSLVDAERQWFKANRGLPGATQTSRDVAFCAHAILQDHLFEVPDAEKDVRFADNPLVAGEPHIRFYAGSPVRLSNGHCVGTLCVIDREPRRLNDRQREVLRCLAQAAARALEGRRALALGHCSARKRATTGSSSLLASDRRASATGIRSAALNFRTQALTNSTKPKLRAMAERILTAFRSDQRTDVDAADGRFTILQLAQIVQ